MNKKNTFQRHSTQQHSLQFHDGILSPLFANSNRKLTDFKTSSSKPLTLSSQIFNQKPLSPTSPLIHSLKLVKSDEWLVQPITSTNEKSSSDTRSKEDPNNPFIQAMLKNSNRPSNKNALKIEKPQLQDVHNALNGEQRTTFREVKKGVMITKGQMTTGQMQ